MGLLDQLRLNQAQRKAAEAAQRGAGLLSYQAARDSAEMGAVGAPSGLLSDTTNPYKSYGDAAVMGALMAPGVGDVLGPLYDAQMFYRHPETRTPTNFGLAALGLLPAVPSLGYLMSRANRAGSVSDMARAMPSQAGMTGYHGSPHQFDEFDMSKIGTGEGAQAYGHGLYFAENPEVAGSYKFVNARIDPDIAKYSGRSMEDWYNAAQRKQDKAHRLKDNDAIQKANAELKFWEDMMVRNHPDQVISDVLRDPEDWPELTEFVRGLDRSKFEGVEVAGNMYTVDIPDEAIDKMLDWDNPVSDNPHIDNEQLDALMEQVGIGKDNPARSTITGEDVYRLLDDAAWESGQASEYLREQGIPGIKYYDGGSRAAGEGTRNFVVFDDKIPKILERNGEPVTGLLGEVKKGQRGAVGDLTPDLPMDEASRMQRARDMGFDTDVTLYHGSSSPGIKEFDPSLSGTVQPSDWGEGVYLSPSKSSGEYYASEAAVRAANPEGDALWKAYEDKAKEFGTDPMMAGLDLGRDSEKYKELAKYDEAWRKQLAEFRATNRGHVYPVHTNVKNPMYYQYEGITDPYLAEMARAQGHDAVYIGREPGPGESIADTVEEILMLDPKNIRSKFAKFDPAKKDSANILAGLAGGGLLGGSGLRYGASLYDPEYDEI